MQGEIVHRQTSDHLRLHGLYTCSNHSVQTSPVVGHVDAAVLLHGLGGNFYSSRLLNHFATTLHRLGVSTILANTRGHDMINVSSWAGRSQNVGAAFESVADSIMDIHAWVDFLVERGHSSILLLGHSLGAIKSLYTSAYQPHPRVKAILALSATRLSHAKMIQSPRGELFRETIDQCRQWVQAGNGHTPIEVKFPFPTWMTPRGYLEKYGPEEKYNWMTFIHQVTSPCLLLFGERELDENPAFEGLREELPEIQQMPNVAIQEIENADHFYASQMEQVDHAITQWLTL